MNYKPLQIKVLSFHGLMESFEAMRLPKEGVKNTNEKLAQNLLKAGGSHAKFARGIIYWLKYDMQIGFMLELDTYRHGREVLSTSSTMHNELRDMAGDELAEAKQNGLTTKVYTQIATYSLQCLQKIYKERRNHRHPCWGIFCDFIEGLPMFEELCLNGK
ncbi:MAG: hypothetical protein GY928_08105 [Colwellia sp.]|nr:hypothetical protein [Colwellia sp.]